MQPAYFEESREKVIDIKDSEAAALQQLGRTLASRSPRPGFEDEPEPERSVITCRRAPGGWAVKVRDAIGLIAVGDHQIQVDPKIPLPHLLYLFGQANVLPRIAVQQAQAAEGTALWELLGRWFTDAMNAVMRRGLIRDYRPEQDELLQLRGQIDVAGTALHYYTGRLTLPCHFEEFDEDTALNRVCKHAALVVQAGAMFSSPTRASARRLLARMEHVGYLQPGDEREALDRRSEHYRDALLLARQLLRSTALEPVHGDVLGRVFLIRTADHIEEGIRELMAEALHGQSTVRKTGRGLPPTTMTLNPDLVFGSDAVGDVKYQLVETVWDRSHLFQLVTFATGYKVSDSLLVAFSRLNVAPPTLMVGDVRLAALSWNASPEVTAAEAAESLADAGRDWAASSFGLAEVG